MFEGEKTLIFWIGLIIGLIILGLASVALFTVVYWFALHPSEYFLRSSVPIIVGGIVFILIGLYMIIGTKMTRKIAVIAVVSLLIVGTVLGFYLWRLLIPKLSYNIVRIPMNELQDEEWFHVEEEAWGRHALIFGQRLETYCGAEDMLKLEMAIQGNVITITETYDSEEAEEQICPYDLHGRIEPLREGTYTIKVIFVDKYVDKTETLYEKTVNFTVEPD